VPFGGEEGGGVRGLVAIVARGRRTRACGEHAGTRCHATRGGNRGWGRH
jgi:hypothetical protein